MPRRLLCALALCLAVLPAAAQAPDSPNAGPWRTVSDATSPKLMLLGHDAVAYFTQNAAVMGNPAIAVEHEGVTWRFASESHRTMFVAAPQKYMPQFGGYCANGINYAIPWGAGGGPDTWRIYRGKLYVFGGQSSRDHFEMDTERNLELAHRYWNDEVAGSNALWQRTKRLVFRVPHYRTDQSLQEEYASRLEAKTLPVMPGAAQVVPAR